MQPSPLNIVRAVVACLLALLLAAPVALAATASDDKTPLNLEPSEPSAQAATPGAGGGGGIVRMVVGLAVVLAVIYGLSWILRQLKASREGGTSGGGLAPVASLPLGPNRSVHVVRVGTDVVVLGVGEKGVTPIHRYDERAARAAGLLDDDDGPGTGLRAGLPAPRPAAANGAAPNLIEALRRRTVRR